MASEKGKRRTETKKKTSRTTSLRSRPCPSGCGYSLLATDTHEACPVCLGILHARTALESPDSCSHCGRMSAVMRKCSVVALAKSISKAAALKAARVTKLPAPEPVLKDGDLECNGQVGDDNMSDSSFPSRTQCLNRLTKTPSTVVEGKNLIPLRTWRILYLNRTCRSLPCSTCVIGRQTHCRSRGRSRHNDANRTTSARSSDRILMPQNQTPCTPRLQQELISIKVKNNVVTADSPGRDRLPP